jgi:hypothetical protein
MTVVARDLSHLSDDQQKIAQEAIGLLETLESHCPEEMDREQVQQSMNTILPRLQSLSREVYDFMRAKRQAEQELEQELGAKPPSFLVYLTPLTQLDKLQRAHTYVEVAARRYSTLAQLLTDLRQHLETLNLKDLCSS